LILGRYFFLGLGLSFAGTTTSIVSYFLAHLIILTALGIAAIMVGVTAATLPEQVSGSYAMKVLLRGSTLGIDPLLDKILERRQNNIERLNSSKAANPPPSPPSSQHYLHDLESEVEEERMESISSTQENILSAVYLPPVFESNASRGAAQGDQRASVYVSLTDRIPDTLQEMLAAPTTLLDENGGQQQQEGIRIFTPGAYLGEVKEIRIEDIGIEEALQYILVESAELCSTVRASEIEDTIVVEMNDVRVQSESETYRHLLGSLPTSLAASVVAVVRGSPVIITNEEITPTRNIARLSILEIGEE
jgi:hypothetical protein